MKAMDKLIYLLMELGLTERESKLILAQFLEEEAAEYILAMEACNIDRYDLLKEMSKA